MHLGKTPAQIAKLLLVEEEHLQGLHDLIRKFSETRDSVIVGCIRNGVPSGCAAELPLGQVIRCGSCGSSVSTVPCVACSVAETGVEPTPDSLGEYFPRCPEEHTGLKPGSLEKIELMLERVARKESPFHPLDARM